MGSNEENTILQCFQFFVAERNRMDGKEDITKGKNEMWLTFLWKGEKNYWKYYKYISEIFSWKKLL